MANDEMIIPTEDRLDRLEMRSISLAKENEELRQLVLQLFASLGKLLESQHHHLHHSENMREAMGSATDAINNIVYALEDIVARLRRLEGKE